MSYHSNWNPFPPPPPIRNTFKYEGDKTDRVQDSDVVEVRTKNGDEYRAIYWHRAGSWSEEISGQPIEDVEYWRNIDAGE